MRADENFRFRSVEQKILFNWPKKIQGTGAILENDNFFVFVKISFPKSNRFQRFQNDFSGFQPFYEIQKRLEKQFCSFFKIQNA